jgi:single-strand DNA-binding protein
MSNRFAGVGNVGAAPELRWVGVRGEPRPVLELRVYFDRRVPRGDGKFEDDGGFWLTVSQWGSRAEDLAKLLQKGARIQVMGTLRQEEWEDRETGANRSELRVTADAIFIDPVCLESVVYRPRRASSEAGTASNPAQEFNPEEIPY